MDTFRQLFVFDKVQRHSVTTVTLDSYYWYRYNWKQLTQALTHATQHNSIQLTDPNATRPSPNPTISQSQSAKWVMFSYVHKQHASSQSDVLTWEADMRKIPQIVQPVSGVWAAAALYFSVFFRLRSIHPVCRTKHTGPLFAPLANFAFLEFCWQFGVRLSFANLSLLPSH